MNKIEITNIQDDNKLHDLKLGNYIVSNTKLVSTLNSIIDECGQNKDTGEYIHISGETDKVIGPLQLSGDLRLSSELTLASKASFYMSDNYTKTKNYASHSGFLQCAQGKYYEFRVLDSGYGVWPNPDTLGCCGAKGFCMLSAFNDTITKDINGSNTQLTAGFLKLSGDLKEMRDYFNRIDQLCKENPNYSSLSGYIKWTIAIGDTADGYRYTLDRSYGVSDVYDTETNSISAGWIRFEQAIQDTVLFQIGQTEQDNIDLWNSAVANEDDNVFYSPIVPEVGNQIVPLFFGQHIEGAATRAMQRASHAEGRMSIADGRYSHAEGMNTFAVDVAAHSEGAWTLARQHAHAEGRYTEAAGDCSHAEGRSCHASGEAAHSEGAECQAKGNYSHAEGYNCYSNGQSSHTHGHGCQADGTCSTACGYNAKTVSNRAFVWNGTISNYGADLKTDGIFCINPQGGTAGFYIGKETLSAIISAAVEAEVKKQLANQAT